MSALPKGEVLSLSDGDTRAITPFMPQDVSSSEIWQQISAAHQFPRVITNFQRKLRDMATINEVSARQATYSLKRGGKLIEGESIRFAEMVLSAWGNAYVAVRPGSEGDRTVTSQAVFWDLESNVKVGLESARRITKSDGSRYDDDMIVVTQNAAGSIALRNCILRGIPKGLYTPAYLAARAVVAGDIKTLATKRNDAIDWFAGHQVNAAQIFAALGIEGIADITGNHLVTLGGFRTAIEDEGRDPEEIFPAVETKASRAAPKKTPAKTPTPPDAPPADATTQPKSDGAAGASSGAAGSAPDAVATSTHTRAPSDPLPADPATTPVTDAATAIAYGTWLFQQVDEAKSSEAIDVLHAESMKSGQWRALQKFDSRRHADVAARMAERQADFEPPS